MKYRNTPVFINNRNRLSPLVELIGWLEKRKFQNIFILDNDSKYLPLLDYYKTTSHKIIFLKENIGYLALWESEIFDQFSGSQLIYTDSDVVPLDDCPDDFMDVFSDGLLRYPKIQKVGFSLKIDDLPEHFKIKDQVIAHESVYWKEQISPLYFRAAIDTTFALYRPNARGGFWAPAIRTAPPYSARHVRGFKVSYAPMDEEVFCKLNSAPSSSYWTARI